MLRLQGIPALTVGALDGAGLEVLYDVQQVL